MKVYYSNLLTKITGIVGVTSIGLLIGLPVKANNALNPNPSVFTEAPYNRSQAVTVSADNTNSSVIRTSKSDKPNKTLLAQNGGVLNPRPSILDECPYNRAACGNNAPSTSPAPLPPSTVPEPAPVPGGVPPLPGTEVPTAPPATIPDSGAEETPQPSAGTEGEDIISVAESNPSFTMLTKALKAAGLVETLKGDGPFTVFAPSDAAFAKLPQDAVQDLLKPENKEVLVKILTYHVVPGRVLSTDLKSGEVKSVEGGPISVKVDPATGVQVNDATVVQPDVSASNGVIHVIDNVILPPDL
ncbi:secreted/surface protein with fasciclin-like repeats [Rivularia sp. PCC 7116]|uniref:fasciclin domain-containing protein n=1 Tax=Rivularia sp. PCC 7116 TaxID=373994 RepID=UPI00029F42F5|nr:fasciclin domain-containing protein [Rivularia sp. PCC 7116]AFY55782.1 secreted/surface protein with fasciclin-like repeats [Rivularia sp. PCC 7116]